MYKITINPNIPDSTYFTSSAVAPEPRIGNVIEVWHGNGTRRAWGKPGVTSTVIYNRGNFAVIHVGFHHKHRGGQGWYYFVAGERRLWSQLTRNQQALVLKYERKAPSFAKKPGNLKAA